MTRTRKWTLATAGLVVLVLLAGWLLVISPKRSEAAELTDQAAAQVDKNQQLRAQIEVLKAQAADLPAQEAKLAEIRQKLPANPALPGLVRSLSSIASKSGVVLVSVSPAEPSDVVDPAAAAAAAQPSSSDPAADDAATDDPAAEVPVGLKSIQLTITVTGSYYDIEQFFNKAEDLTRSMMVTGFTMNPAEEDSGGTTDELTSEITARVYYAPADAAAAATTQN